MKQYRIREIPQSQAFDSLAQECNSIALASVLWGKGVREKKDIQNLGNDDSFLLSADELYDLPSFWNVLKKHIEKKSKIAIYGDYDADGAIASSILWRFLSKELGVEATIYIPDRHEEGYGLNKEALLTLAKQDFGLVITVDCGIRDGVLIEEITSTTKMDILVTDHHQPSESIPKVPVVHPMHPQKPSANSTTSGGVVAWKVVRYIEAVLKLKHRMSEELVDLAGISLVTDIMPIKGENRVILKKALEKLRKNPNLGIAALLQHAQVDQSKVTTYHLGYVIGPRLNASGRIGDQYASARLLCTDKQEFAYTLAQQIHEVNVKRQDLTKNMLHEAEENKRILGNKLLVAIGEDWDDGIIGLVAGRLMNTYDIPTIAVTINSEKKEAKGSARSFGELNITELLSKASALLTRFGGHHNAAGFSLEASNVSDLLNQFEQLLATEYATYEPIAVKHVDSLVKVSELTDSFFSILSLLEPFGHENAAPLFGVRGIVQQFNVIGATGQHVKYDLATEQGTIKVLQFNGVQYLSGVEQGKEYIFYGEPKRDEFNGKQQLTFVAEFFE